MNSTRVSGFLKIFQGSLGSVSNKSSQGRRQWVYLSERSRSYRSSNDKSFRAWDGRNSTISWEQAAILTGATLTVAYFGWDFVTLPKVREVHALKSKRKDDDIKIIKLTSRERRFLRFASVEYDGQLYMTPQDFLESVVEAEPRPRLKRKTVTKKELELIRDVTPPLEKGSSQMFRNLRDRGIVSYTEYLFLLSILTKPQTGFRIAFNMFDTDGNEKVDKTEFLVLLYLIPLHSYKGETVIQNLQLFVRNWVESVENSVESAELTLLPKDKVQIQYPVQDVSQSFNVLYAQLPTK